MKNKFVQALIFVVITCAVGFMMGTTMAMITNKRNEKPSVLAPPPTTDKTDNKGENKEEDNKKDEKPDDGIVVSKPSNFEVAETASTTVLLSWGAPENTKGLVGFTVYNANGEPIAELPADSTSYLVEGLSINSIYSFKIKSNYENGESSNAAGVNVRTTK